LKDVLDAQQIMPDFTYAKPQENTNLFYVHRKLKNGEIFWVNNRNDRVENLDATFRVEGKEAEVWRPETGKIEKVSYTIGNGSTKVQLHLESNDAIFIVFRNKANANSYTAPKETETQLKTIDGPWDVSFQAKRGAPTQATFVSLTPWNENADQGIKYFSGTGIYTKTLQAPADWFKAGTELWIDLGKVQSLAEVFVNGKSLGIVWKTPFRINATEALKQGENKLEIKVTNLWVNRLIGDRQPDVKETFTYTITKPYKADSPLKPSGLMGPVQVISLSRN
jgi:hypothetical protein